MKDRIRLIQNKTQMSQQDFAKAIGVAPGSLSSVYSGRTEPSTNFVKGIHAAFPDINTNWLIFGEGEMNANAEESPQNALPQPGGEPSIGTRGSESPTPTFEGQKVPENTVKNFDIKQREVMEIRVFFSDGTYESYLPAK